MSLVEQLCARLPETARDKLVVALGIEGSANKVAVGIILFNPNDQEYHTVANVRKTYITPAGQGFLPRYLPTTFITVDYLILLYLH